MAVANSSKAKMALGFSLHVRAGEAISKFQKEIEDDFNYLHEILAEAKQHFGRRDSNILLPKTPSMKRKHQDSDEEQSSFDNVIKTTTGIKAPKTQGYASPLTVINENDPLDCSVADGESKQERNKRTTRATRAGAQAERQQPKRGSRKNDLSANKGQTDSSSVDEKPRRNTRNTRKKAEEKGAASSSNDDANKLPKKSTRNTRKKILEDAAEISSTEELPSQLVSKKSMSSISKTMEDSGEVVPAVMEKQEPTSPVKEMQPVRRTKRNSNSRKEEEKEIEIIVPVPETPDLPTDVTKNVMSPPTSAKTCKASVQLILQSPGFNIIGKGNGLTPTITSSPCIEQDLQSHDITVEEIVQSEKKDIADDDAVTVCSVVSSTLLESAETLKNEAVPGLKSGTRSTQRNSGWRRKSKRSSQRLSPANRLMSVKKTVTKSKAPGKKSLIKSSVKLKLMQSKLMPELKLNGSVQIIDDKASEPNLEGVRVRLFETSESSTSASSATSHSSCSSTEDKADVPVKKLVEEPAEDDVGEVFHDFRGSENETDDETENTQHVETDSNKSPAVVTVMSPVASHDSSSGEGSEAASVGTSEEFKTPPQEKQEAVNPAQKAKPSNIALVHSFIRRNTPKKVDPEEKKNQLRIALKEKEEKEKERREYLEMQKQREIEERKKRREERAKKAAEQRAAKLEAFEKKKRQAEDQRQINEEKAKKIKDKEDEDKRKQRLQKKAELEARRRQEEAVRQQRKREQEEDEKRQREALQKKQELEEQERQRKIAEAKRHQEHREKELEKEREMEKQRKLKAIEEKEKRLREKEEKSREEKQRIEREREERERARIAQLIREKEEAVRREREQRAREEKGRQDREKKLKEEREAGLREKRRQEEVERERIRVLEERKLAAENQRSCDSYEMTPPPVRIRKPSSQENYNIADLNSDDSTDEEDNPRKKIPAWARPPALTAAVFRQEYSDIDVNSIFDSVPAPKLEEIFTKKKPRYNQRTSSAIWNSPPLRPLKKGTIV